MHGHPSPSTRQRVAAGVAKQTEMHAVGTGEELDRSQEEEADGMRETGPSVHNPGMGWDGMGRLRSRLHRRAQHRVRSQGLGLHLQETPSVLVSA